MASSWQIGKCLALGVLWCHKGRERVNPTSAIVAWRTDVTWDVYYCLSFILLSGLTKGLAMNCAQKLGLDLNVVRMTLLHPTPLSLQHQGSRSPWERLKVLERAWKSLRGLERPFWNPWKSATTGHTGYLKVLKNWDSGRVALQWSILILDLYVLPPFLTFQ